MNTNQSLKTYSDEKLKYNIFLSKNRDYVIVDYKGVIDRIKGLEVAIEASNIGKINSTKKCFLDLRECINEESIVNNYEFAYNDTNENSAFDRSIILVMLVDIEDHSHNFIETVLRNNGFNITIFRDEKKALEYIEAS